MAGVTCETGPELVTAQRAAEWVRHFYPDITATLEDEAVHLSSSERDASALRLIWLSSLANETLLARGASHRAAVIEALVR